jgi:hypothetical protein
MKNKTTLTVVMPMRYVSLPEKNHGKEPEKGIPVPAAVLTAENSAEEVRPYFAM